MFNQENKGEMSNRQASSSKTQNSAQVQLADLIELCSSYYIYAEEKTVKERMIRPKPEFLAILKAAGAEWEVFTWKEICNLLKDYINLHHLFDEADPRIVNCDKDLLGKVFGVSMFTLGNAMHYINANCYNLADSCEKRCMCLVAKPREAKTITSGQRDRPRVLQVACPTLVDIEIFETEPGFSVDITAPSTQLQMGVEYKTSQSTGQAPRQISESLLNIPRQASESLGQPPRQISESLGHTPRQASESLGHQPRQTSESLGQPPRQTSESLGQPPRQTAECSGHPPRQPSGIIGHRPMGTSHNMNYSEPGSSAGPLCSSLELTGGNNSQDEDDVIAIDLEGGRFEYEVVSEDDEEIISSTASVSGLSENNVMIICADSDVEFWADSSEAEFSEEDYWTCTGCNIKNPPLIGRCTKCSKLRPYRLPEKSRKKQFETSHDNDLLWSSECCEEFFVPRKKPHIESESLIKATNEKWTTSANQISPIENDMGIYRNLMNYQSDQPITSQVSNQQMYNRHMLAVNQNPPIRDKQVSSAASKKEGNDLEQFDERCIICLNNPKSASIVHGSSGHQVCCFRCAKRLYKQKKPCPICRRSIQKVIKNFIV